MEMKLKSYFIRIIENSREQKQKKPIIQSSAVNATVPLAVSDLFNCEAEKNLFNKMYSYPTENGQ